MHRKLFLVTGLLVGLACVPEPGEVDNSYEIQRATITKITTEQNDTITLYDQGFMGLQYQTGHTDCFQRHDSVVTREDSVFYVDVRQKVYTGRMCLDISQSALLIVNLGNKLPRGEYKVVANRHTSDTLVYTFWVHPPVSPYYKPAKNRE